MRTLLVADITQPDIQDLRFVKNFMMEAENFFIFMIGRMIGRRHLTKNEQKLFGKCFSVIQGESFEKCRNIGTTMPLRQ